MAANTWLAFGLVVGLVFGLGFGLAEGQSVGLYFGIPLGIAGGMVAGIMAWVHAAPRVITTGLMAGLGAGVVFGLTFGSGNRMPGRIVSVRWRQLFRGGPLVAGLIVGIVAGALTWLFDYYQVGVVGLLGAWLGAALVAWLAIGLIAGMSRPETDNASPLSPLTSRRSDRMFGLVVGLVVWLAVGLAFGIAFGIGTGNPARGFADGLGGGLVAGLLAGLVYPQSWSSSLAFAQLAASDRTPVRLMRFLEDARSRSVLRTVGPVYQFRHARLQDRLAVQEPAAGCSPGERRLPTGEAAAPTVEAPPASAD